MSLYSRIVRAGDKERTKPVEKVVEAKPVTLLATPSKAKRGRPKTDFDKAEYNRQFMRDLRTIKRLGLSVTVAEYRKSLVIGPISDEDGEVNGLVRFRVPVSQIKGDVR